MAAFKNRSNWLTNRFAKPVISLLILLVLLGLAWQTVIASAPTSAQRVSLLNGTAADQQGKTGILTNTVWVTSQTAELDALNNQSMQTTTVTFDADLQISKDDQVSTVYPGDLITYTIVAFNAGPGAISNAVVEDTLPAVLLNASWQCVASVGSVCGTTSGTDSISTTVDLAVNGQAIFTLTATLAPQTTGVVFNRATITPPAQVNDFNTDNNQASDTDVIAVIETTGLITGLLYIDGDANGVYSPAVDQPLVGVQVVITDANGTVYNVTTDANGRYAQTVAAGDTTVDVNDAFLPAGLTLAQGSSDPSTATVPVNGVASDLNGYIYNQAVSGIVYLDHNQNGVFARNDGDQPLANVSVIITDSNGLTYTVYTDAAGFFHQNVPAGETQLDVVDASLPKGVVLTTGSSDPTTLTVLPNSLAIDDTGYVYGQTVDGLVYLDMNQDGAYTQGDLPIVGATVIVTDSNGTIYTLVSDDTGYFSQNVPAGTTWVDVLDSSLPVGLVLTVNSDDPTQVDVPVNGLASDSTGYQYNQSVDGVVYVDVDQDGQYNPANGDTPIAGITVQLSDSQGVTHTVVTDGNGYFTQALPAGAVLVVVVDDGLPADMVSLDNRTTVIVPLHGNATDNTGYTTGDVPPTATPTVVPTVTETPTVEPTATETATVEPTATETATPEPTATATVEPTATETPTAEPTATETATMEPTATETATVEPTVTETATVEPTATETSTLEPTATETATVEPTATEVVTVEPTATETATVEPTATETATVEPTATEMPSEVPTATETATVLPTETATAIPTATATPTQVPTATETATVVPTETPTIVPTETMTAMPTATAAPTATETPTATATATATALPSDTPTATPSATLLPTETPTLLPSSTPSLTPTALPTTATQPAALGDLVWWDQNKNGVQDAGEPGIAGVVVTLVKPDGTTLTTVTDANGLYLFSNLEPGLAYRVIFTTPAGYSPVSLLNPENESVPEMTQSPLTVLGVSEINLNLDAGYIKLVGELALLKQSLIQSIVPGTVFTHSLTYTNTGNTIAHSVVITEKVPLFTTFVTTPDTAWSCSEGAPAGTPCTLQLGNLMPGQSGTVYFTMKLDSDVPNGVHVTNVAQIGDIGSTLEPGSSAVSNIVQTTDDPEAEEPTLVLMVYLPVATR